MKKDTQDTFEKLFSNQLQNKLISHVVYIVNLLFSRLYYVKCKYIGNIETGGCPLRFYSFISIGKKSSYRIVQQIILFLAMCFARKIFFVLLSDKMFKGLIHIKLSFVGSNYRQSRLSMSLLHSY